MKASDKGSDGSAEYEIEGTAADWLGRCDGGLTAAEASEFNTWIEADPRHASTFAELEAACRSLDGLTAFRPANSSAPDPNLPLIIGAPLTRSKGKGPRHWMPIAMAVAAVVTVAFLSPQLSIPSFRPSVQHLSTNVGEIQKRALPDGSTLELNTDSRVDVSFTDSERRVTLVRGEAYFSVAKDASRPFIVTAGGIGVRAVGTAFNVRLRADAVDVLVTEGRVRVADQSEGPPSIAPAAHSETGAEVAAGERALIRATPSATKNVAAAVHVQTVDSGERERILAWQDQRLEFGPTPLRDIVAEFNRYNRQQMVVANAETGALSVGGTFQAKDPETFLHLLQSSFGISIEKKGRQTILLRVP